MIGHNLCATSRSRNGNLSLLTSCKVAVIGVGTNSFLLGFASRNLVHAGEVRESVVKMELLHSSSNLHR